MNGSSDSSSVNPQNYDNLVIIESAPPAYTHKSQTADDLESTSLSNSYSGEWEKLFGAPDFMKSLRFYGLNGKLRSCRFRSLCWKVYLHVLNENTESWLVDTNVYRQEYDRLKTELIVNPRNDHAAADSDLDFNNPLSQDTQSPWNQYFNDNELRLTIKQDVVRTFPEVEFYQQVNVHTTMIDVLFCYAKRNHRIMYKQGMHELLAPLIFILHCDHQAFQHVCELGETISPTIRDMLNPEYLEHDAYAMFCRIMDTVEPWYVSKELSPKPRPDNIFNMTPFTNAADQNSYNVIVNKLSYIQNHILRKFDAELYAHLERLEIAPQIYGIRWVRLLFGREFPMQDLLVLWDAIFADSITFDLVDYIFVAMLLYIRDHLMSVDYGACLGLLMHFPAIGDVNYFIEKAIYLRDPQMRPRPLNYSYRDMNGKRSVINNNHVTAGSSVIIENTKSSINALMKKLNTGTSGRHRANSLTQRVPSEARRRSIGSSPDSLPITNGSQDEPGVLWGSQRSVNSMTSKRPRSAQTPHSPTLVSPAWDGSTRSLSQLEVKSHKTKSMTRSLNLNLEGNNFNELSFQSNNGKIHDLEAVTKYCATKMDIHLDSLQNDLMKQSLENEDSVYMAVAGLKQVRDILRGTLKSRSLAHPLATPNSTNQQTTPVDEASRSTSSTHSPVDRSPVHHPNLPNGSIPSSTNPKPTLKPCQELVDLKRPVIPPPFTPTSTLNHPLSDALS